MLDEDLAELYEVRTKRLNEQVKRNIDRFPKDFMFQLTMEEFENLKSQYATSSWGGRRKPPYAFTEHGVLMLSTVLRSGRAVQVNIQIMRVFVRMRELLLNRQDLMLKVEQMDQELIGHGHKIQVLFDYIKTLIEDKEQVMDQENRMYIGFNRTPE